MTLKNSFWAKIKENNKRRIWLWLLSVLGFVVAFPTIAAMTLSKERTNEYLIEIMGETLGRQAIRSNMIADMEKWFGISNYVLWIAVAGLAVVSAIHGFSYLFNKRKIDFYMGMPVKRSKRFLIIWLNGILVYTVPYLIGMLIGWLIVAGSGIMTFSIFKESLLAFGIYICYYLGVYHLAVLAVMLTGNVTITCFGVLVFFLYEYILRGLIFLYQNKFFKFFSNKGTSLSPVLSPFTMLSKFSNAHAEGAGNGLVTAVCLLFFSAVTGIIAYACYLKRPAEAAGKAMAFKISQPFIKILLVVPSALFAGYIAGDVVNYEPLSGRGSVGFVIFAMAVVLIVISCLIQVLYEFDIKGIFHKKQHLIISAVAVTAIFLIFRYDAFGYDDYLPKPESVSSAAIIPPYIYSYYDGGYYDDELNSISMGEYVMDYMYLTDIGAVNKLVKLSMDVVNQYDNMNQIYTDYDAEWYYITVAYRMGKRNVYRSVPVNVKDPEVVELLDRLESTDEYINGIYPGASDRLEKLLASESGKTEISYGTYLYQQKMSAEEAEELLALYKEDIKGTTFSMFRESVSTGSLILNIEERKVNYTIYREMEVKIYPFFTKCVDYLQEHGFYMENFINPQDVERIQVTNYNSGYASLQREQWEQEQLANAEATTEADVNLTLGRAEQTFDAWDYVRYATYDDEASIQELCGSLYLNDWITSSWHTSDMMDSDYRVTVYFKAGANINDRDRDGYGISFSFLSENVPEFVKLDTSYN